MPRLMLDRKESIPEEYALRNCLLVSYRLPFLRHCFVLCHEPVEQEPDYSEQELLAFFFLEAKRLANETVGNPQSFVVVHSGESVRKRINWHMHVYVVKHRWQKAWLLAVLSVKNFSYAVLKVFMLVDKSKKSAPNNTPNKNASDVAHIS